MKRVSGILVGLLALALVAASPASAAPFAYVSNFGSGTVSVIDGATNTVVATVPVGTLPVGVAVNPQGTRAYVVNSADGTVSVIDVATNTVVGAPLNVGLDPWGVAVNEDGSRVYVAKNSEVGVINTTTNPVSLSRIVTGGVLNGIAVSGSNLFVTVSNGTVLVIDLNNPNSPVAIPVGSAPFSMPMGVVAKGTRAYVSHMVDLNSVSIRELHVSVIETASSASCLNLGTAPCVIADVLVDGDYGMGQPGGIAISPVADGNVYVTNDFRDVVTEISTQTNTVVRHIPVGLAPFGVATDSTSTRLFVGNAGGGNVSVIDMRATAVCQVSGQTPPCVVATVTVGSTPFAFGAFVTDGPAPAPSRFTLTLTPTPAGSGSITPDRLPEGGSYAAGTRVALTPTPASGRQFSGWSDACSGSGDCTVTMDGNKSVTATFTTISVPPPPSTCEAEIADLQKKVSRLGRHHGPAWLKAALYARGAADYELKLAKKKAGDQDPRYLRALKEFKDGDVALCAERYWRAKHEYWDAFDLAHRILRSYRSHRR